ncbi:SIR2 family protein [Candidatus Endomicrobiellum agilis]|uniref:SIR2 family protein n=1 Tax=Candidatus Endomicrobiellum agilis TaxID=3238957 RepID=UPI003575F4A2|nr:SIR2 family protein [Endomicrobium sp.]
MDIIDITKYSKEIKDKLIRMLQSCNLNFLVGSGCSTPGIELLGDIEQEINKLKEAGRKEEAENQSNKFKEKILNAHKDLNNKLETVEEYRKFLDMLSRILHKRPNINIHKKANIFTTNYDLFIEQAANDINAILNDGFERNVNLKNLFKFSTNTFFNTTYNNGQLYNYEFEIPKINLFKLHGSVSWKLKKIDDDDVIIFSDGYRYKYDTDFVSIMPSNDKFEQTVIKHIIYDLIRMYANEIEKENTLLISLGFSFEDKHLLDITRRGLKNSTLNLVIFCYDEKAFESFKSKFKNFDNVSLIHRTGEELSFKGFNKLLTETINGI